MKKITITQRVQVIADIGERRDALSQEWAELADACGFLPVLLPNRPDTARQLVQALEVDGIILSGGNSLTRYGGDAPERDETEHFLVDHAERRRIPLLGVCRGMQLLLDHYQTPLQLVENHVRVQHRLDNGDTVNSFHGFGAVSCAAPLAVTCRSLDGVVEGVQHMDCPWIRGVMWHPERYHPMRQQDIAMIKELFDL